MSLEVLRFKRLSVISFSINQFTNQLIESELCISSVESTTHWVEEAESASETDAVQLAFVLCTRWNASAAAHCLRRTSRASCVRRAGAARATDLMLLTPDAFALRFLCEDPVGASASDGPSDEELRRLGPRLPAGNTFSLTYADAPFLLVGAALAALSLWTCVGNVLVGLALLRYKNLRTISNFLIGNLALSDLLLSLTVLPFSITNDLLGHWVFGPALCKVWLVMYASHQFILILLT